MENKVKTSLNVGYSGVLDSNKDNTITVFKFSKTFESLEIYNRMNYCELLHQAHENNKQAESKAVPCYKTSFPPPKKIERSKNFSGNVKKFLEKKVEEGLQQSPVDGQSNAGLRCGTIDAADERRNRPKTVKAEETANSADSRYPNQFGYDDYGYESQEAAAFYEKYENMPSDSFFDKEKNKRVIKDLAAAKDRVKAALRKEGEDAKLIHKKKRKKIEVSKLPATQISETKNTADNEQPDLAETEQEKEPIEGKKKKKYTQPPIDFNELLKLAAVKQFEPVIIEKSSPRSTESERSNKPQYLRMKQRHRSKSKQNIPTEKQYKQRWNKPQITLNN